jgi:Family of unknown function (DUF6074)
MTPEKEKPATGKISASPKRETAELIPFPIGRRRKLVGRIALTMKRKPSNKAANEYLAAQMTIQAKAMKRKGMEYGVMRKQLCALEAAVRTELWRLILGRPSPDGDDAA